MLNDPQSRFKYVPAVATDIRKTFARVRKAIAAQKAAVPLHTAPPVKADPHVVPMHKRGAR